MPGSSSRPLPEPLDRDLRWDGCVNVRDLGGHPTEDGGTTRFRAVVRADSVRQLSDAGWAAAVAYGVRTIVDLRFHSELDADPARELPVDVVHVSLLGDPVEMLEIDELVRSLTDPVERTRVVYLEFLERFAANVARAVAAVGRSADSVVVVHCQGGKDRTGLVCALLLRLAGVSRDHIGTDYAASVRNLAPLLEDWIAEAPDESERELWRFMSAGPAEAMVAVLAEIERRCGRVGGYLGAAGATDGELERARTRIR